MCNKKFCLRGICDLQTKIESKDLILDKAKLEDLNDIFNNFWSQKDTAQYMLWKPCESLLEAKGSLEKIICFQKDKLAYFVYDKNTRQAIGIAGMQEIKPGVFEDCGIGIGNKYVGRGLGKQLLMTLINYCKNELKAKKIICSCFTENVPSAKMQKACGFKYTHSEKHIRKWDNKEYIADYYELIF